MSVVWNQIKAVNTVYSVGTVVEADARTTPLIHHSVVPQRHSFISGYRTVLVCAQLGTAITAKNADLAANVMVTQSREKCS